MRKSCFFSTRTSGWVVSLMCYVSARHISVDDCVDPSVLDVLLMAPIASPSSSPVISLQGQGGHLPWERGSPELGYQHCHPISIHFAESVALVYLRFTGVRRPSLMFILRLRPLACKGGQGCLCCVFPHYCPTND